MTKLSYVFDTITSSSTLKFIIINIIIYNKNYNIYIIFTHIELNNELFKYAKKEEKSKKYDLSHFRVVFYTIYARLSKDRAKIWTMC